MYQHKDGSRERAQCLDCIAESLNSGTTIQFKFDQRTLRDKIKKLLQLYVTKRNKEECSSGISQEYREFDDLLQEIHEQKNESEASYRHQHQLTVIRKGKANKQGKGGC